MFRIFSNVQTLFRISSGLFRISWLCSVKCTFFTYSKGLKFLTFLIIVTYTLAKKLAIFKISQFIKYNLFLISYIILYNYQGEQTHCYGELTQGELEKKCIRANKLRPYVGNKLIMLIVGYFGSLWL